MIKSIRLKSLSENVRRLYLSSFPPQERLTEKELDKMVSSNKPIYIIEYYEDKTFLGFIVNTLVDNICYLGYFAVNDKLRRQGYGSKIMQNIKREFANRIIIFGIEEVADINNLQDPRTKRYMFYKKNGFFINDFNVLSKYGGIFNVVSSKPISRDEIDKVIQKWVPGIFKTIKKGKSQ